MINTNNFATPYGHYPNGTVGAYSWYRPSALKRSEVDAAKDLLQVCERGLRVDRSRGFDRFHGCRSRQLAAVPPQSGAMAGEAGIEVQQRLYEKPKHSSCVWLTGYSSLAPRVLWTRTRRRCIAATLNFTSPHPNTPPPSIRSSTRWDGSLVCNSVCSQVVMAVAVAGTSWIHYVQDSIAVIA
jgi:hypothetical protein